MSEQSRRDMLASAARWALAGGSIAGILSLSARRGDCRLALPCTDCALASSCSLPKRADTVMQPRRREDSQRSRRG